MGHFRLRRRSDLLLELSQDSKSFGLYNRKTKSFVSGYAPILKIEDWPVGILYIDTTYQFVIEISYFEDDVDYLWSFSEEAKAIIGKAMGKLNLHLLEQKND